jgi:transposase-like protein
MQWNPGNCDRGNAARWARVKFAQGWTIADLAQRYGQPPDVIAQMVACRSYRGTHRPRRSRALPVAEKQARAAARTAARSQAQAVERTRRWLPDPSDPEAWRWRDGGDDLVEVTAAALPPDELAGQDPAAGPREAGSPAAQLESPAPEPWSGPVSPHASPGPRPRKITAEVLAEALHLHAEGMMSWPAIARKFGCHRQSLYFARRRSQS